MKVNVLGTEYDIVIKPTGSEEYLGMCFYAKREIVVDDLSEREEYKDAAEEVRERHRRRIMRHEILHAFLYESGLSNDSSPADYWAVNEEMVDWFAIQAPKIYAAYQSTGCMEEA